MVSAVTWLCGEQCVLPARALTCRTNNSVCWTLVVRTLRLYPGPAPRAYRALRFLGPSCLGRIHPASAPTTGCYANCIVPPRIRRSADTCLNRVLLNIVSPSPVAWTLTLALGGLLGRCEVLLGPGLGPVTLGKTCWAIHVGSGASIPSSSYFWQSKLHIYLFIIINSTWYKSTNCLQRL
jgi:hypothetical protein